MRQAEEFERSLADCLEAEGPDSAETLAARALVGKAHLGLGRFADAAAQFEAQVAACERVFGPDRPETFLARSDHARALVEAGQISDASQSTKSAQLAWNGCSAAIPLRRSPPAATSRSATSGPAGPYRNSAISNGRSPTRSGCLVLPTA